MRPIKAILVLGLLGQTACMGSDTDSGDAVVETDMNFAALTALETTLIDEIVAVGPTATAALPDSGEATYQGTIAFALMDGSNDGAISAAEITADFATNAITGGADDFYDLDGNATDGSVVFEDAILVSSLNLVAGNITGNITFNAGAMDINIGIAGNLSGAAAEYISGVASGTATPEGGGIVAVQGAFYAEQ